MVLVKGLARRAHQGIAGPGLRNQHHHRVRQRIAAGDQQFEGVVERGGVRLTVRDQRPHLVEVGTEQVRFQRAAAGVHPVDVAAHGVDLAVVGDEAIGVGQLPRREGVGGKALVRQSQGRLGQGIGQILVKGPDLMGEQQALVDNRPRRKRRHVEARQLGHAEFPGQVRQRVLRLLADGEDLAFEGVLIGRAGAARHDRLADHRHLVEHRLAQARRINRHVAPADQLLALNPDEVLELADGGVAGRRISRHEAHGHGVIARRRQIHGLMRGPVAQQGIGDLNQNPGPVANQRVSANRAAMVEVDQNLQAAGDDLLRFFPLYIRDKADSACVMFMARVIKSLLLRKIEQNHPQDMRIGAPGGHA